MRALLCVLLVVAAAACSGANSQEDDERPTADPSYRAPAGPVFGVPVDDPADNKVARTLIANIDNTPEGATIRIVGFSFSLYEVADALVAAHRRGVDVQVVLDGHSRQFKATRTVVDGLGEDTKRRSFVKLTRRSARGTRAGTHQKSWSFSRTGRSRWVTMVGSMNLTMRSTEQYTDMFTYVGRRDVWRAFGDVFRHQVRDRPMRDPAFVKEVGGDTAYFYPGFTEDEDPLYRVLASVPGANARIRISMYAWHHPRGFRLARLVEAKVREGAEVTFVEGPHVDDDITEILRAAGAEVHTGDAAKDIHTKLTILEYDGPSGRERTVITGSDNFADLTLHNDDVDLVIDGDRGRIHERYVRFFDRIVRDTRKRP